MKCGYCHQDHPTAAEVKACSNSTGTNIQRQQPPTTDETTPPVVAGTNTRTRHTCERCDNPVRYGPGGIPDTLCATCKPATPNPPPSGGVDRRSHIAHGWKGHLYGPTPAREEVNYAGCSPQLHQHPDGTIEFTVDPGWFDRNVYRPSLNPVLERPPSQLAENIRVIRADREHTDNEEPF